MCLKINLGFPCENYLIFKVQSEFFMGDRTHGEMLCFLTSQDNSSKNGKKIIRSILILSQVFAKNALLGAMV